MSTGPLTPRPIIDVAAAVIRDESGRVLLSQRPEGKHLAGLWEFPGGKREAGESVHGALVRELEEELGIEVSASMPLLSLTHHYPEKSVRLLIRTVDDFRGTATGQEGQRVGWFEPSAARTLPMPAADRPIIQLLSIDPRLVMLPEVAKSGSIEPLFDACQDRLDAGFRLFCLRCGGLDDDQLKSLATRCSAMARQVDARWLIDGRPELARALGADGLHLPVERLADYHERPVESELMFAVSCRHDDDLEQAARLHADFACLSPRGLASAPDWHGFAASVAASPLPLVALGVDLAELDRVREMGAFGVAVSQAIAEETVPG